VVYRNLAMVYTRQGNQREKAQATLEKAVQFGGNATVFSDLDKLYEEEGVSPAKRLALMEAHQGVIDRDEAIARESTWRSLRASRTRRSNCCARASSAHGRRRSVLAGRLVINATWSAGTNRWPPSSTRRR